ncbi:DMT family transporter [Virgibacillus siamensis]|uniref:DMT family transporter n=1 Tax=Virgibacillus siamensis TaxID=480071 RepID=UPI00098619E3|nr:multidrug efflux SMR transporter [Virgibacillus siamensis]
MNRSWTIVFFAGLFEIGWVVGLKHANSTWEWLLTVIAIYFSMHLLIVASRKLPVGTAYAVFTGMGTAGTVILDFTVFGEPFSTAKVILIAVLLSGVIGLKIITTEAEGDRAT